MFKRFYRVLGSVCAASVMCASLVGCTQAETQDTTTDQTTSAAPTTEQSTSKPEDSKKKQESAITLMASQNWIKDIDRELFKKFQDETGIEVKVLVTPDNGYETLLGTSLAGGSNAVDMFMYSAGSMMVSAGISDIALELNNEEWVERLESWASDVNTYDEKLYGFSTWGVDYEGILYNKTYFEENNLQVPTTWNDFIALCDQIIALGKVPMYESINGVWHTQSWVYGLTPVMYKEDPEFITKLNASKDNKLASSQKLVEGLTQLEQFLGAKEGGKPKYYTNDGQAEDWFGSYPSLQNRDTIMMFTYSAYAAELAANGSTDEWGMFPVPLCDNQIAVSNGGGISKFINKSSANIDACKELLNFLAKPENLEAYYSARNDLVTSSFVGVESINAIGSTNDMRARTKEVAPIMMLKDLLYWDPDIYKYCQGLASGTMSVDQFITNMDAYRATMFEAAGN